MFAHVPLFTRWVWLLCSLLIQAESNTDQEHLHLSSFAEVYLNARKVLHSLLAVWEVVRYEILGFRDRLLP